MALEDALAANTKALAEMAAIIKENNRLMTPISEAAEAATSRREGGAPAPAAATTAPATAEPATPRRRRGSAAAAPGVESFLPPDPKDFTIDSFTKYVIAWVASGDEKAVTADAVAERQRRKTFVTDDLCDHLGIEKISLCEPEDRPIIIDVLKGWVKDPKIDFKAKLPMSEEQQQTDRQLV